MIKTYMLMHPQSAILTSKSAFKSKNVLLNKISCGTTKVKGANLSEAADFHPTYASLNSSLFETSVILTLWEHSDELLGDDHIAILHSDVNINGTPGKVWKKLNDSLDEDEDRPIALTIPNTFAGIWKDWIVPEDHMLRPQYDPYNIHCVDNGIFVWDLIKKYDSDLYEWAFDVQPEMIYAHQFACSKKVFDILGEKLYKIVSSLRLKDIGFWTPHMFERMIALYLAKQGDPKLTTAFIHFQSSGVYGPGDHSLYGPRPLKYYHTINKYARAGSS
jgi:hypothetical protein